MAQNLKRQGRGTKSSTALDVFINCPFDLNYKPIFNAMVYTVVRSGYRARCALETDDAAQNRLSKIIRIIGECPYGIHDISRTETDGDPPLPRFNMPLELGIWFGAHHLGRDDQAGKQCIVFDTDKYRYQRFISDIGGQDIHAHGGEVERVIGELVAWLRQLPGGMPVGGGKAILREYRAFEALVPILSAQKDLTPDELVFADFNLMAVEYATSLRGAMPEDVSDVQPAIA